jgi:hypothetical protein
VSCVYVVKDCGSEADLNRSGALRRRWFGARRRPVPDTVLPSHFLPVARALGAGQSAFEIVTGLASDYARDGEGLPRLLNDLHRTYRALGLVGPEAALVRSASEAWAESFMSEFGHVSCEDPLTGLATANHLRLRLAELYRSSEAVGSPWSPGDGYRLLAVMLTSNSPGWDSPPLDKAFRPGLELAVIGKAMRTVFPRACTVASVSRHTVLGIAHESDCPDSCVQDLTRLVEHHLSSGYRATVRVEPLPGSLSEATRLVDQRSRRPQADDGSRMRPPASSTRLAAVRPEP